MQKLILKTFFPSEQSINCKVSGSGYLQNTVNNGHEHKVTY